MESKTKIMVLAPPASGHVNPMCGLVYEICRQKEVEVIFYSEEKFQNTIDKTGAKFKSFCKEITEPQFQIDGQRYSVTYILSQKINYTFDVLPQLISEVETEKPDLIIYDSFFTPAKYLLEVLKTRDFPKTPKSVMFLPQFVINDRMVQSLRENAKETIWSMFSFITIFKDQLLLNWRFGISIYNPIKLLISSNDHLNVVGLIPEIQPYIEECDSTYKFVGSCISEDLRSAENYQDDKELESILKQIEVKQLGNNNKSDLKLIYLSLGTSFNINFFIYETVIEAVKNFNQKADRHLKSSQFRVIISTGDVCFNHFNEKISNGELTLPENILIRAKVPQLEILKRADLFITHCGMNSTNEAIKYAVPIIGLPLEGDQPMVAKRVCDELSLGIRFDPLKLYSDEIATAIDRVISDESFKKNISDLSRTSAKYNGPVQGAKMIMDYLNQ